MNKTGQPINIISKSNQKIYSQFNLIKNFSPIVYHFTKSLKSAGVSVEAYTAYTEC